MRVYFLPHRDSLLCRMTMPNAQRSIPPPLRAGLDHSAGVSIAIVNYNTRRDLRSCLDSISADPPGEVIVIDNGSTDGSVEMVSAEYPRVHLIVNLVNVGYGAAANQAVRQANGETVLLLNSDTRIPPGTWRTLHAYLNKHPRAAIVGPRILNANGTPATSCFPFPGALDFLVSESSLAKIIQQLPVARSMYLRTWDHGRARIVPWVLGAALGIRKTAFETVNGFDPAFFMYMEEVDLCYRLSRAGWQVHFTPSAAITHFGGTSTAQYRTAMAKQLYLSRFHFYRKHYTWQQRIPFWLVTRYVLLRNLVRDKTRLRRAADPNTRLRISEDIFVWQQLGAALNQIGQ